MDAHGTGMDQNAHSPGKMRGVSEEGTMIRCSTDDVS
jgi:hypothetical protein